MKFIGDRVKYRGICDYCRREVAAKPSRGRMITYRHWKRHEVWCMGSEQPVARWWTPDIRAVTFR